MFFFKLFLRSKFNCYFQRFLGSSGILNQCVFLLIKFQDSNTEVHNYRVFNVSGKFIRGEFSKTGVLSYKRS